MWSNPAHEMYSIHDTWCGKVSEWLAVLTVIVTITGGLYAVLTVILTITERYICSANSYCDNNDNNGEVYM